MTRIALFSQPMEQRASATELSAEVARLTATCDRRRRKSQRAIPREYNHMSYCRRCNDVLLAVPFGSFYDGIPPVISLSQVNERLERERKAA